jgi:L-cysteine S-thiosulfotransferase
MIKFNRIALLLAAALATLASTAVNADDRLRARLMLANDFRAKGQAGLDRLETDALQHICNQFANQPPEQLLRLVEADQIATVKFPADGKLMGDWKEGEKIAQSGKGFTWTDKPGLPVGGNCYNCHEISPKELSFGTLGPSLRNFGKMRGNTPDTQKYVFTKIFNAKSFNACSAMPRFGHIGALNEEQIQHLVALLLDPESPVNK